jgi:integrase
MRARINRRSIAALQPDPARQAWLYDTELRGFLVLCQPSGRKSYVVRYPTPGGSWRKLTLGPVAELDPDAARELARDALAAARRGEDPTRDRKAPTVAKLAERFNAEHAARLKPGTARNYRILWDRHILPRIGTRRVADLRRADIAQLHDAMRDRPINANRALEVVSKALNMAEIWGWRDEGTNPCRHVTAYPEQHRQRTLNDVELRRLWGVLDRVEAAGQEVPAAQAIRLLLLTGCRVNEWLRARWDWIDWQRGLLQLPDTKTGARDVHLPATALAILRGLPRTSVYILPGTTGGPIGGMGRIWGRMRREAGLPGVRLHDLRHTVGSLGNRAGLTQRQIADLLGHRQLSTTARYINSADDHKKETADAWSAVVASITG